MGAMERVEREKTINKICKNVILHFRIFNFRRI